MSKDNYDMVFFGGLYPKEIEEEVFKKNKSGLQTAANTLQWSIIKGFDQLLKKPIIIFNMMFIGSYPKNYRDIYIKPFRFSHRNRAKDYNIGFLNITVIKELFQYLAILCPLKRWVNRKSNDKKVAVFYSLQNVWISSFKMIKKINHNIDICMIVPDLPDYFCMGKDKNFLYRVYKKYSMNHCKKNIKYVDSFVFLTEDMKDYFHTDKPYVVMEGIVHQRELDEDNRDLYPHFQFYNKKTILYTGSLEKQYGVIDLMKAFLTIKKDDYRLIICGDGEAKKDIMQYAKIDQRIIYLGMLSHNDILRLQKQVTVLINPRKNEGEYTRYSFPSKLLEYLSSGVPVIAYKLDGIPDEYDDYIYYINGDRDEDIAEKMTQVCEKSEEERIQFGIMAKSYVTENKNCYVQVKKITDMIDRCMHSEN